MSSLECTVSLLHSFEKAAGLYDWEIGTHGLLFEIEHEGEQRVILRKTLLIHLSPSNHSEGKLESIINIARVS